MQLDTEQDRQVLLQLISSATIQGSHALVVADLIQRVQAAKVAEPSEG